ncbi:DUF3578 domain-containing protein [Neobacillus sp. PS3-34]|uniref:MrcB family domain-containing protein n=1 Tax=Neobacillus sp. PS3-34 TaxID=3070678 RepID=UPI0027DF5306|nr:DUF3578 domain-containing protein [Neobacillus sp. PS3-34]WML48489.1 DUF3578 domain-containing protein [Neobacillus sp. PS3-34]
MRSNVIEETLTNNILLHIDPVEMESFHVKIEDIDKLIESTKLLIRLKENSCKVNEVLLFCLENFKLYSKIYETLPGKKGVQDSIQYEKVISPIKKTIIRNIEIINNMLSHLFSDYYVTVAFETGRVHKIPYIGLFNKRITSSSQTGFYTVVFFDIYKKNLYLSLNIGNNKTNVINFNEIKRFLIKNINLTHFNNSDSLEELKPLIRPKTEHYLTGNIVGTKVHLIELIKSDYDIEKLINSYLFETDRLVQLFLTTYPSKTYDVFIEPSYIENYETYNTYEYCNVGSCNNLANFAVFLYDKNPNGEEFLEHDFTCSYICEPHMVENESSCKEERIARSLLSYKYTNRDSRHGYSKYLSLGLEEPLKLKILSELSNDDFLEVSKDVEVFYELLTQDDLELPLNIGIFGDWGSGKSFFINQLIKKLKDDNSEPNNIVVEFNAWNYYDSNIIVNLIYKIFEDIQINYDLNSGDFLKNFNHYEAFTEKQNKKEREEIYNNINELKNENKKIHSIIQDKILKDIKIPKKIELENIKKYTNLNTLTRINIMVSNIFKERKRYFFYLPILFIIGLMRIVGLSKLSIIPGAIGLIALVKPIINILKIINNYLEEINKIETINGQITELEEKLENLSVKNKKQLTLNYLKDFIIEKINHQGYKNNLGFIATVNNDIKELRKTLNEISNSIKKDKDIDLPPINKIILIIEDLDRCSEEKVVDVLQSIQLLLSTDLFVVIFAVDSQWINKCIISQYNKMITNSNTEQGNLFAINYLEKIIHLPFWLRKMNKASSNNFIHQISNSFKSGSLNKNNPDEINKSSHEPEKRDNIYTVTNRKPERNPPDSRKYVIDERFHYIEQEDLIILSDLDFIFENTSPRKTKRFLNTLLLIKNGNLDQVFNCSNKLLYFIVSSIVLQSDYTCDFYKMVINKINNNTKNREFFINEINNFENITNSQQAKLFWERYKNLLNEFDDVEFNNIDEIIYEVSRYTYFHHEITKL